jgi:hypothetical protein
LLALVAVKQQEARVISTIEQGSIISLALTFAFVSTVGGCTPFRR